MTTTPEVWITLTAQDIYQDNAAEFLSIAAIKGVDDRATIVSAVTDQVQDAYRSGGRILGPPGTIPSNLKERAVAIALWKFITTGVPRSEGVHTKAREGAHDDAVRFLEDIATRKITGQGGVSVVSKNHREFTRNKMKGL